jgi:hypothetical protein
MSSTEDQARQLNAQWLSGQGKVTQLPGAADPSTRQFYSQHQGYDFGVPAGTPIKLPQDYNFVSEGYDKSGFGNRVALQDPKTGEITYLSHLSQMTPEQKGLVKAGTIIAYTGGVPGQPGAGNTTGAHLDITTDSSGKPVGTLGATPTGQTVPGSPNMASVGVNSPAPSRLAQNLRQPLPPISNTYSPEYLQMMQSLNIPVA